MKMSDKDRLSRILSIWEMLKKQIDENGITEEKLLRDQFCQWAVTTPLYNIGEQVYFLSAELKSAHPEIPWSLVSGLRHRLVHDYEGINWTVVVEVIFREMEPFAGQVRTVLKEIE